MPKIAMVMNAYMTIIIMLKFTEVNVFSMRSDTFADGKASFPTKPCPNTPMPIIKNKAIV